MDFLVINMEGFAFLHAKNYFLFFYFEMGGTVRKPVTVSGGGGGAHCMRKTGGMVHNITCHGEYMGSD